ncbi:Predicted protein [Komagataella phaffii CBS 7435]|nr:Predicted protein [Komagataella phaffii CBS 7435]
MSSVQYYSTKFVGAYFIEIQSSMTLINDTLKLMITTYGTKTLLQKCSLFKTSFIPPLLIITRLPALSILQ